MDSQPLVLTILGVQVFNTTDVRRPMAAIVVNDKPQVLRGGRGMRVWRLQQSKIASFRIPSMEAKRRSLVYFLQRSDLVGTALVSPKS